MVNKPLVMIMDEAKKELTAAVNHVANHHGLPYYLLETILSDLLGKVQSGARGELAAAQKSYAEKCKEETDERVDEK